MPLRNTISTITNKLYIYIYLAVLLLTYLVPSPVRKKDYSILALGF